MLKKILVILIATLLLIGLSSCKVNAETKFTFEKTNIEVGLNGTVSLWYNGGTGTITWASKDPSIAKVENGRVTGLKIGETIITATRGEETATCTVKVVYNALQIGANGGESVQSVNLILKEHDTENLIAKVRDANYENVTNPTVNWKSSDSTIVTIDETSGKINAVKSGKATITAEAAGVSDTCEVTVYDGPEFTDFKDAKYETSLMYNDETLKISGVIPKDSLDNNYYYIITSNTTKPELALKYRIY